jgi:hypothetical protein
MVFGHCEQIMKIYREVYEWKAKNNLIVKCKGNYGYKFSEFQPLKEVHGPIKWER